MARRGQASGIALSADLIVIDPATGEATVVATGAIRALSWRE